MPRTVGGCKTTERVYGVPALQDSLARAALDELMAPGVGPKTGAACRRLGVDAPLFVRLGAVNPVADSLWESVAERVTDRLCQAGCRIAGRSLLRHTTGTCFPPYHVDFDAVGDSAQVAGFLHQLTRGPWGPLEVTSHREERVLFLTAGCSLSVMDVVVDLRLR